MVSLFTLISFVSKLILIAFDLSIIHLDLNKNNLNRVSMIRSCSNWFIFFFNVTITHCELIQKIKENNSSIVSIRRWAEGKVVVNMFTLIYFVSKLILKVVQLSIIHLKQFEQSVNDKIILELIYLLL